jgi:outer membrane protein assembly factor BamB
VERWQTRTDIFPAVVAVTDDRVIVSAHVANPQASQTTSPSLDIISALDASDGKRLWSAQQDAYASAVTAAGGTVSLTLPPTHASGHYHVAALRSADGSVLWRQPVGPATADRSAGLFDFGVLAPDGSLFCVNAAGILYGLRTSDGRTLWGADLSSNGLIEGVTIVS